MLDANEGVLNTLHQLRGLGIGIALDDFGTGYSSLSYLQSFPFTRLKIDRSFVQNLGIHKSAGEIVMAIVSMAKAVQMNVTAEGVETQLQLDAAIASGCTEFQGYLFSRPRPRDDIAKLLSSTLEALVLAA